MLHRIIAAAGFRYSELFDLGADSVLWAAIAREYPILGIDVPLTVIEWSDDTAAVSLHKQSIGLKAVRDAYVGDPIFARFTSEIAILAGAIEEMESRRSAPRAWGGIRAALTTIYLRQHLDLQQAKRVRGLWHEMTIGPRSNPDHQRLPVLDGLRGLAAYIVVVSHVTNATALGSGLLGFGAGQIGVMLFFVLSGFLMGSLYLD